MVTSVVNDSGTSAVSQFCSSQSCLRVQSNWRLSSYRAPDSAYLPPSDVLSMIAYLVLLLAALSRLVPHALHGIGLNFTAVGAGLLFFGSCRPRSQAVIAAVVMALTDVYLTTVVYGMPFHVQPYLITWAWYGGVALLGSSLLHRLSTLRVVVAVLCSATSFFLLSNFVVWATGSMYPHTVTGLGACYVAAIPFYANDLASTGLTSAVLFGLPVVATQAVALWRNAADRQQPLL